MSAGQRRLPLRLSSPATLPYAEAATAAHRDRCPPFECGAREASTFSFRIARPIIAALANANDEQVMAFVSEDNDVGSMAVDAHGRRELGAFANDLRVFGETFKRSIKPIDVFVRLVDRPVDCREIPDCLELGSGRGLEPNELTWLLRYASLASFS